MSAIGGLMKGVGTAAQVAGGAFGAYQGLALNTGRTLTLAVPKFRRLMFEWKLFPKTQKESTNGKYMSITIKEVMLDADSIINKYKEMDGIEGLMSF